MASLSPSIALRWTLSVPVGRGNKEEHEWEQQEQLGACGTRYLVKADCLAYGEGDRAGDSFELAAERRRYPHPN